MTTLGGMFEDLPERIVGRARRWPPRCVPAQAHGLQTAPGNPPVAWRLYVDFRTGELLWAGKVLFFLIVFIAMIALTWLASLLTAVYDRAIAF